MKYLGMLALAALLLPLRVNGINPPSAQSAAGRL
jgi:hypothetical protein